MKKSLNFRSSSQWREHQLNVWTFILIAFIACIAAFATIANADELPEQARSLTAGDSSDARSALSASVSESLAKPRRDSLTSVLAPEKSSNSQLAGQLFKGLIFSLAIFYAGVSLYKRFVIAPKEQLGGGIEVLARRSLGPRTALLVVSTEGQKYFLAQTGDNVSLLSAINDPESFADTFSTLGLDTSTSEPRVALAMERR